MPTGATEDGAPLHIGYYSPALPDSGVSNGIVTYTRIMRDALRDRGHYVTVVTTTHIERADGQVVPLPQSNSLGRKLRLALEQLQANDGSSAWVRLHVLAACKAAKQDGVEVLEIEETHGWAGRLGHLGIPIVERLHGPHIYGREPLETQRDKELGDLREIAERTSFTRVHALTSPSAHMLTDIVKRYDLQLPLSRVIPNPISTCGIISDRSRADPTQILCVGRFDLRKGADIVVKAFAQALERQPMRLVMAGPDTGIADATGSRSHFVEYVKRELPADARARIQFLGPVPPNRIAQLRAESGLAVVGSRFENFPYSIAEAMAFSMPVLTSATFGGAELVRDGIDGRVVPVGDVPAMREALLEMTSNPHRLRQMGEAGFKRAAEWLSPDDVAGQSLELYRDAMARTSLSQRIG